MARGGRCFLYNLLNLKRTTWQGPQLGAGKHTIVFDFKTDEPGLGKGGTGVLSVDGKEVARNSMEHGTPITFAEDETFDIGQDTRTPLALIEYRYDVPFKFTGKINKLTFKLGPFGRSRARKRGQLIGRGRGRFIGYRRCHTCGDPLAAFARQNSCRAKDETDGWMP